MAKRGTTTLLTEKPANLGTWEGGAKPRKDTRLRKGKSFSSISRHDPFGRKGHDESFKEENEDFLFPTTIQVQESINAREPGRSEASPLSASLANGVYFSS